jgi:hypothetical protein
MTKPNSALPIQHIWSTGTCYGCGPGNPDGLHLESFWSDDGRFVIARVEMDPKYTAGFPNVMYGGTVASLIDCHSIWTAIAFGYRAENRDLGSLPPITYVTGKLTVNYVKPTPLEEPVHLKAWVEGEVGLKTRVICELGPADDVTATGDVLAVSIDLGRWESS